MKTASEFLEELKTVLQKEKNDFIGTQSQTPIAYICDFVYCKIALFQAEQGGDNDNS